VKMQTRVNPRRSARMLSPKISNPPTTLNKAVQRPRKRLAVKKHLLNKKQRLLEPKIKSTE
jgi:hypothetical protein